MGQGGHQRRTAHAARVLVTSASVLAVLASACATRPRASVPAAPTAAPAEASDGPEDETDDDTTAANESPEPAPTESPSGPCPGDMAPVDASPPGAPGSRRFCVDKYEASLVETLADGSERPYPHYLPVDGHDVRAVSVAHVFPQGYISEVQAQDACAASSKRLCSHDEWKTACMGPSRTTFPYGQARQPGACHDTGKSAVIAVFGAKAVAASTPAAAPTPSPNAAKHAHATKGRAAEVTRSRKTASKATAKPASAKASAGKKSTRKPGKKSTRPASVDPGVWARLNDPGLGQVEGALAKTGEHDACVNGFGVFDMMGNLHEWVAGDTAVAHGTFAGGYYLDTTLNGDGCLYRTTAHAHEYHDYSTGFRCCSDAQPPKP